MRSALLVLLGLLLASGLGVAAGTEEPGLRELTSAVLAEDVWVEAQLASLSTAERIGQLFVARAHSDGTATPIEGLEALIEKYRLGGVCFFGGTPESQVQWTNALQAASAKTPLLISMDAEWGLAMRFGEDAAPKFPYALTMGAANDPAIVRAIAAETGRELRRIGVNMSFAPVADINSDPANPVIHRRSFGELPVRSGQLALAYARGLKDAGVLAVAKHFPGHGATAVDSHADLPVLPFDRRHMDTTELLPFRMLAQDDIAGVMTGHLAVPAIDPRPNRPASLSAALTGAILRRDFEYEGLIVTDGLDMAGVTEHFAAGEESLEAFLAGNDVLLIPGDIPAGIRAITGALREGTVSQERLDASVRRILHAKYQAGLAEGYEPVAEVGIRFELNSARAEDLKEQLYRKAITVARRRTVKLPIVSVDSFRTAVLTLGAGAKTPFSETVLRYGRFTPLNIPGPLNKLEANLYRDQLNVYDLVVVGIHGMSPIQGEGFGVLPSYLRLLRSLRPETRVILTFFGTPYALDLVEDFDNLVVAYEDSPLAQKAAAEVLYGATPGLGSLPVTAGRGTFPVGTQVLTGSAYRMRVSTPGNAGFSVSGLARVDTLVQHAISSEATPGGVVLAARDGQIGLLKAYGRQTYARRSPEIDLNTVYDLASITKIAASTVCIMKLHEEGKVNIYGPLGDALPQFRDTDKGKLIVADILAHQARLRAWIPFYKRTLTQAEDGKAAYKPGLYKSSPGAGFSIPVTDKLFLMDAYRDSIYTLIAESELREKPGYRYSDLGFYIMAAIVRQATGMRIDEYADRTFYRPLGLRTIGYNPLLRLSAERVPPTEEDDYFRFGRVQGYVHDMGAAMLGGVSGHAGLFSDVNDLATLMQMLLNEGYYGGRRYLKPETVRTFVTRHPKSTRRGLGFDMAELSSRGSSNMSPLASSKTFGHLGFTGTCAWADPETGVLFVWLTNRTYPNMETNQFGKDNYRPRMQTMVYEAMD